MYRWNEHSFNGWNGNPFPFRLGGKDSPGGLEREGILVPAVR